MSSDASESFTSNWEYLKTELRWLDQVLMLAVTRQRKENHEVERLAQSKADRVTSHWWKGLVSLEGKAVYDEHRQPVQVKKSNYQEQLTKRIEASHGQGVALALPLLCDRLNLTLFEKNLVLMSLAPELNRRYAKLYRFLQGEDLSPKTDLPTLNLALRLLCRNDKEWRTARNRLASASPLLDYALLECLPSPTETWLNRSLKLAEPLVNYLLAEAPTSEGLDSLLKLSARPACLRFLNRKVARVNWSDLILPAATLSSLKYLGQQIKGFFQAEVCWGFALQTLVQNPGISALLVGEVGTGKTMAAEALADMLQTPLYQVDLAQVLHSDYIRLLKEIETQAPKVLLLKSAQLWLGRSPQLASPRLHQFFSRRQQIPGVTLFSVRQQSAVQFQWQRQVNQVICFPLPGPGDRRLLWQQAFAVPVPLHPNFDWDMLATQLPLSGGKIQEIAQQAILYAAAMEAEKVNMTHLVEVLERRGIAFPQTATFHKQKTNGTQKQTRQKQ
jgi:hypothetical protein